MNTIPVYTKGGDKVWLYSDDTFTLAISDCSDPEMATETTETTPVMLADIFSADTLRSILAELEAQHTDGRISIHELSEARDGKLGKALAIATLRSLK